MATGSTVPTGVVIRLVFVGIVVRDAAELSTLYESGSGNTVGCSLGMTKVFASAVRDPKPEIDPKIGNDVV